MSTSSSSYPQSPQDAALIYISLGWPIFPCASNKRPLVERGFKSATRDPKQIIEWWSRWRHAEPAVALPPSQLVVDLDRKGGHDAFRDFERLAGFPVDQFASPQATTPSGGRHVFCNTEGRTFRNTVRIWERRSTLERPAATRFCRRLATGGRGSPTNRGRLRRSPIGCLR